MTHLYNTQIKKGGGKKGENEPSSYFLRSQQWLLLEKSEQFYQIGNFCYLASCYLRHK